MNPRRRYMFGLQRTLVTGVILQVAALLALGATGAGQNSGTPEYFKVSPTITAPGQFVNFSWRVNNGNSFAVTPSMLDEDEATLPPSAQRYTQVAPDKSTVYKGMVWHSGAAQNIIMTAPLKVVPVTLSVSSGMVHAGQPVTLTFTGPNNGSSFFLTTLPENATVPLTPDSCDGSTCAGKYLTETLGSNKTFRVGATGPLQGQAYSQPVAVTVSDGMTLSCAATPVAPGSGEPVTIAWRTTNATSLRIDQGLGEVAPVASGSVTVHPTQSSTYTCTATDRFGDQMSSPAKVIVSTGDVHNLNHIIFLVQENRAFDNYFGALAYYRVNIDHIPGAQMSDVNDLHTLPPGYTIQNPQGQSFPPFHERTVCEEGMNPNWNETHYDMDLVGGDWLHLTTNSQYLMDKFLFNAQGSQYDPTDSRPLGYYDWTDLPFYYELASQFNTSDTFYSPVPDATTINRLYLFAGTSYGNVFPPADNSQAWTRPTIFHRLQDAGISWRYYYQDNTIFLSKFADWNYPGIQNNVRNIQEWYDILASNSADQDLPQVVFIERAGATLYDEHPGNNMQNGVARVQQILTPLLTSNAWPDSAFILTYDEGGGTYDQQPPVLASQPDDKVPNRFTNQFFTRGLFNVTGFRVPVMLVSPWSKPHYVWHQPGDYTSILKLIETRYSIMPLTHRDRDAADLTDPVNGPFNFNSPQMLQVPALPTQPTNGTCNWQLEGYPN